MEPFTALTAELTVDPGEEVVPRLASHGFAESVATLWVDDRRAPRSSTVDLRWGDDPTCQGSCRRGRAPTW